MTPNGKYIVAMIAAAVSMGLMGSQTLPVIAALKGGSLTWTALKAILGITVAGQGLMAQNRL